MRYNKKINSYKINLKKMKNIVDNAYKIYTTIINKLNKIPWRVSMMYLINEKINNNLITTLDHHHHYSSKGL